MPASRPTRLIAHALAALSLLAALGVAACASSPAGQRYYQARAIAFAPGTEPPTPPPPVAHAAHFGD